MCVLINLLADGVLILIEAALLGFGNVAVVKRSVEAFLGTDRPVLPVQLRSLCGCDLTAGQIAVDAGVLICKAVIDLGSPRMGLLPSCGRGDVSSASKER